jgi:V8-like Glu-specific endopeptidase
MMVRRSAMVILVASILVAASGCRPGSATSGVASPQSSGSVIVHALDTGSKDPHARFRTTPAGAAVALPSGSVSGGVRTAQSFTGVPSVGALFLLVANVPTVHYCTASVVHSAGGDLIVTAAHCVYSKLFHGYQNHILFVPGYHDGTAPYGTWVATSVVLDSHWVSSADPDVDVAFLTVRRVGGGSATLESVTGAHQFQADPGYTDQVDVVAYPLVSKLPISCANQTSEQSATQVRFDCGRYSEGSSGGPFLTGQGVLVGVLGGYQQGGATSQVSYSSYFGARIQALYQTAAAGGRG